VTGEMSLAPGFLWHEFNAGRHIQIGYVVAEDSHALA